MVEVLGDAAAESGWAPRDTRLICAGLGALAVLGRGLGGLRRRHPAGRDPARGAGAAAVRRRRRCSRTATGDLPAGTTLAALAAVVGGTAAVVLLGRPLGAAHLVLAAAVLVLVAAAGAPALGGGDAVFLALGVIGLLALLGGLLVLLVPATPARAAAVVAPLALALTTAMPTLALRLSRIPRPPLPRTATDLAEVPGQLELEQVQQRVRRARSLLTGLLVGCYTATALATVVLATDTGSAWPGGAGRGARRRCCCCAGGCSGAGPRWRRRCWRPRWCSPPGCTRPPRPGPANAAVLLGAVAPVALLLAAVAGGFGRWGGRAAAQPAAGPRPGPAGDAAAAVRGADRAGRVERLHAAAGAARVRRLAGAAGAGRGALRGDGAATAPAAWAACSQPVRPGGTLARRLRPGPADRPAGAAPGLGAVHRARGDGGRGRLRGGRPAPQAGRGGRPADRLPALVHQRRPGSRPGRAPARTARTTAPRSPG